MIYRPGWGGGILRPIRGDKQYSISTTGFTRCYNPSPHPGQKNSLGTGLLTSPPSRLRVCKPTLSPEY